MPDPYRRPGFQDPEQVIGSVCECERGPRVKYRGGCAECEAVEATRTHDITRTPERPKYTPKDVSRGEVRRFLERRFLDSTTRWARD